MELTGQITFALLKPVLCGEIFAFCLDDGHRDRLTLWLERTIKHIIRPAAWAALASAINDVHRRRRLFQADARTRPPTLLDQAWIDQFKTRLGFVARHRFSVIASISQARNFKYRGKCARR